MVYINFIHTGMELIAHATSQSGSYEALNTDHRLDFFSNLHQTRNGKSDVWQTHIVSDSHFIGLHLHSWLIYCHKANQNVVLKVVLCILTWIIRSGIGWLEVLIDWEASIVDRANVLQAVTSAIKWFYVQAGIYL